MKYREFSDLVLHALKVDDNSNYSDDLVYEATCNAIDAILPWIPRAAIATIIADGILDHFALPDDCYSVEAVQDVSSGTFVERDIIAPGKIRNRTGVGNKPLFSWLEYPQGELLLSEVLDADSKIRVYYTAYFSRPSSKTDLDFVLNVPRFAIPGMVYFTCAHCLIAGSAASAEVRQWSTKTDSGKPVDNVLENTAKFYRQLFLEEMSRVPRTVGASK